MIAPSLRLETHRFGPFIFQLGIDEEAVKIPLIRVEDAWRSFNGSPLAQVANQLQREVLVQSVFGTNTIEGANLTEEETSRALDLDPTQVQAEQDIRVRNIKMAYELALAESVKIDWQLSVDYIRAIHTEICRDLPHSDNRPGLFRDNTKERPTVVGDASHGGTYRPPQYRRDIEQLMDGLVLWHQQLVDAGVSSLLRAPLIHLYYEWIHPFWDGNGRVGRVLEATILRQAGYKYAPFALAKFYQEKIHQYFTLFNTCRKSEEKHNTYPNTAFLVFHLDGLRIVIDRLHERVNQMVGFLLFDAVIRQKHDEKEINPRQYAIIRHILSYGRPLSLEQLRLDPRYQVMYLKKTDKTKQRDLKHLNQIGLVWQDDKGLLWPCVWRKSG